MVTVEKLTEGLNRGLINILFMHYGGINFVKKNNAVTKILDFQNDDMSWSPIITN